MNEKGFLSIEELIRWCNTNQGFLDLVLSVLSIIISVIAIIVSIRAVKVPYKYKLSVNVCYYRNNELHLLDIITTNYGLGMAAIKKIIVTNLDGLVCASTNERFYLKNCEERIISVEIFDCQEYYEENATDLNNKVRVIVFMMDGKNFTFKDGFTVG